MAPRKPQRATRLLKLGGSRKKLDMHLRCPAYDFYVAAIYNALSQIREAGPLASAMLNKIEQLQASGPGQLPEEHRMCAANPAYDGTYQDTLLAIHMAGPLSEDILAKVAFVEATAQKILTPYSQS